MVNKDMMDLKLLYEMIPSWEWPDDLAIQVRDILENQSADANDRLIAAEMAGDSVVMNDTLAQVLLAIIDNDDEPEQLRSQAAISLGPALEHADLYEFHDPDDIILSEEAFTEVQRALESFFFDSGVPAGVRRSILEAAVRAPQDWHIDAVRAAYSSEDENWRLTAVFCMRFLKGFDRQILESLKNENLNIRYQAISAAGNWELKDAWPFIARLLENENTEKEVLLIAIDAAAGIGTSEAIRSIGHLLASDDDDVVDAVHEALAMIGTGEFYETFDDDE